MRIAVDAGGTFTDFIILTGGEIKRFKLPSTSWDPSEAVRLGCAPYSGFELLHGTTVATNAILEGKGARTGLVVNESFRDLLRLGRQSRPELYDIEPRLPSLPVRDEDVRTVRGRISKEGAVLKDLDLEDLYLGACSSVAICLLYSYANPEHEKRVSASLNNDFVCCSHEVSPEMREYERACATVLNAAVGPIIANYFERLTEESSVKETRIMSSLGGLISLREASRLPLRTIVSGPAGGVAATVALGKRLSRPNLIAFDMGGTSTDVTLIHEFSPAMTACSDIVGLPVRIRRIDVQTIGCGGGSLARIDEAGALRVGPESAGAEPGPALYGGKEPTVTDANFVLGRLPLTRFAKTTGLDPVNSATVFWGLAKRLGLSIKDAAEAVITSADSQMAAAVRKVSADKGFEPRGFSLVAFGGAGALHACAVADLLEIAEILVPVGAGVFSAVGLLGASHIWEESLGVLGTDAEWEQTYAELTKKAIQHVAQPDVIQRVAEMRYKGQSHELAVAANGPRAEAEQAFADMHFRTFGTRFDGQGVQWVTARVRVEALSDVQPILEIPGRPGEPVGGIIDREQLTLGHGPLIIADDDSTVYVAEGWSAERLHDGTIRIYR